MWRIVLLILAVLATGFASGAEMTGVEGASAALVTTRNCPELRPLQRQVEQAPVTETTQQRAGLSPLALLSTLGIGLLSILCFVPAALLIEFIGHRGGHPQQERTTCSV